MIYLVFSVLANANPKKTGFEVNSVLSGGHYYEYGLKFLG